MQQPALVCFRVCALNVLTDRENVFSTGDDTPSIDSDTEVYYYVGEVPIPCIRSV